MNKEFLTHVNFMNYLEYTIQSYKSIKINEDKSFFVYIIIARVPKGGRKLKLSKKKQKEYVKKIKLKTFKNQQEYCNKKKCIINVFNSDNLCGLRAILIAIAFESNDSLRFKLCEPDSPILNSKVNDIVKILNLKNEPMGFDEFKKIEEHFKEYQITIFNSDAKLDKTPIYIGNLSYKFLYLSYTGTHYNVLRSMKVFFKRRYFCDFCKKAYSNINSHKCEYICKYCKRQICLKEDFNEKCKFCDSFCYNAQCLNIHEKKICFKARLCLYCNSIKSSKHVCGESSKWCFNCKKSVEENHMCYILKECEKKSKIKKFSGYIFFDYEAKIESGLHSPNLIVVKKICIKCLDSNERCLNECQDIKFYDNSSFCAWLFTQTHCIALAHNLKGYDGVFVMNYILENFLSIDKLPSVCLNGTKIIYINFRNVTIIDSFSFLPISLEKFTDTFSLEADDKKSFFPHYFNKDCNQNYNGVYPAKEMFGSEYFSIEKKIEFNKWYEKVKFENFNFREQFEKYCVKDVEILAKGCLEFRKIIKNITKLSDLDPGVDPFRVSSTLPSLCHFIFRRNFMKKDSIAVIPSNGYINQNYSFKSFSWLKFIAEKNKIFIRHARNGGEYKLGNHSLDGYCQETNTVYEFHGCFYHGCPKCFQGNFWNSMKQSTMKYIYSKHLNRIKYIKACNVNLIEKWECEWDHECNNDEETIEFFKVNKPQKKLNPRDALYGGRNNAFKLYFKCSPNQKVRYFDYNSLYPSVQKYCSFPIGHPEIITDNFLEISSYFGLVKCKIIPPKKLYIPVLPLKIKKKLIYTLCFHCALHNLAECNHSDDLRALDGTWVILEVLEALKYGYKIDKIYEIWHWREVESYNHESQSGGLFTECINLFYKFKQEASGYPSENPDKSRYIEENFLKEGIVLDLNNIKVNNGLRQIMKFLLNAFWGKYGMKCNKPRFKVIFNPNEWFDMVFNTQLYIIHSCDFSNEKYIVVFYSFANEELTQSYDVNVVIAAFVTCHARLKLFSELIKLNDRVLYFDTDSIIFIENLDKKDEYIPLTGNSLGEFKDELKSNWIVEYVSAGCKSLSFIENDNSSKCIIKGFALNHITNLSLNFESIKKIVTEDSTNKIKLDQLKFSRDKYKWTVKSEEIKKNYSMVYDKRVLIGYNTLPFGF
jgi:hypothetical protein